MTESVISMLGFLEERPRTVREVAAHLKIKPELARCRLRTQSIYFRVAMPGQRTKEDGQYRLTIGGKRDLGKARARAVAKGRKEVAA